MAGTATPWSCVRCTFENEPQVRECAICLYSRPMSFPKTFPAPVKPSESNKTKKSPQQQSLLVRVGSSVEKEEQRVQKKLQQLKELGIDLASEELLDLLAKNCYSVHVAACDYFERMAKTERQEAAGTNGSATSFQDEEEKKRLEVTMQKLERELEEDYQVLGIITMAASVNRSGVTLQVGEQVLLQAENAGKKRLRPGMSTSSGTSSGVVRIATMAHAQIGRLERDLEILLHPMMKSGLVTLGGACEVPPVSSRMFASFNLSVVVYVSAKAFEIFKEGHTNFHLSDALYSVLQMVNSQSTETSGAQTPHLASAVLDSVSSQVNPEDLDTLFSECIGANELDSMIHGSNKDPSEQLLSYLQAIQLRDHQKQALRWMLWREAQLKDGQRNANNPLWEERHFRSNGSYYVNPFERSASLTRPTPPKPCLGGILADDMGMGKTMMILSLVVHQKYYREIPGGSYDDSPPQDRSNATEKTLVVCPLSLLHQWKNEAEKRFLPNTLSVHVYYGDDRDIATTSTMGSYAKSDVVLTTYGVLSTEHGKDGLLITTEWTRVILDEAHSIKNRATAYFKACSSLQATHRWCLTGTPIQNTLDDVFSLLSFLQYEPWSRIAWWKRGITKPYEGGDDVNALGRLKVILTPVLLRRTKYSRDKDGNKIVQLPSKHVDLVKLDFSPDERAFYQAVYDKSQAEFNGFVASGSATSSYVAIFALLLRLRQACNHPLLALGKGFEQALKPSQKSIEAGATAIRSAFQPQENESSEAYYQRIAAQLQQDMQASNRTQLVKDSCLGEEDGSKSSGGGLTESYIQSVIAQVEDGLDSQECPICLDPPQKAVLTPCAHVLCEECLRETLSNDSENGCPVCRTVIDMDKVFALPPPSPSKAQGDKCPSTRSTDENLVEDKPAADDDGRNFESAKLQQLLRDLKAIKLENEHSESPDQKRKVVVFSQWTSMLDMVSLLLKRNGFSHCVFNGSLQQEARERVLTRFEKDPTVEVLVISLKAGGVGLNLTCASVVILLDPWWNPGVEEQAIDRVHRLGQTRDVLVKRYVVNDTVEDMILQLQQRKEKLAKHVLVTAKAHDERRSERLNLDDLRSFFHQ